MRIVYLLGFFLGLVGIYGECASNYDDECILSEILAEVNARDIEDILYVRTTEQAMYHVKGGELFNKYVVSTSKFGSNCIMGKVGTPWGLHQVVEKIGDGEPVGMAFSGMKAVGKTYKECLPGEFCCITTRILRIRGLEEGLNLGQCADDPRSCDTYERSVMIHGTDEEDLLGTAASWGCIRIGNMDIVRLFESVEVGALVYIDKT